MKVEKYLSTPDAKDVRLKEILKTIFAYCYIPIEYILLFVYNSFLVKKKYFKYSVSLCAIFKNEAPYLKEWIEYHKLIGVDHIYLYNNFSDDNYREILEYYINNGYVELIEWPIKYGQLSAYQDCYQKTKNITQWLGFIDIDEFVNLQRDNNIKDFLGRFKNYPSILLCWRMFGTSGYLYEDYSKFVIERYTSCWRNLCDVGKSFINNSFPEFDINHVHIFNSIIKLSKLKLPLYPINDNKKFSIYFRHTFSYGTYNPKAYINHYWSKSYERYIYKDTKRGDALNQECEIIRTSESDRFLNHESKNSTKDFSIQRFQTLLKINYDKK